MPTQVNTSVTSLPEQHGCSPPADAVQHAVEQVLSSPFFRNTQQCQTFLRYIVKYTVSGEDHLLRERVIGSEVFGRRPDYEPGEDPVVRLRASEVRKRLAQFYQSTSEPPAIRIEIPAGSYKAIFHPKQNASALDRATEPAPVIQPEEKPLAPIPVLELRPASADVPRQPAPKKRRFWLGAGLVVVAVVAVAVATLIGISSTATQNRQFHQFWAPWTRSPNPVIIAIGSNAVYRLSDSLSDQYAHTHGLQTQGEEFFVPFGASDTIRGQDLLPAANSFVALGDVAAVSHLVANLSNQNQKFQERFPNDISFAELRNSPSVLVGGFNNPMTIELTRKLRFVLRARNEIDDTQNSNRRWVLNASPDSHDTEDYAIITRVAHSGDSPMLSVAGMGQYGTLAAADFICNPAAISDMARNLPRDWDKRNVQIILHVNVLDFKVAATQVVATHTW